MITAIIQARMGSRRLPGKVLKDICGYPMLWHVVNRVRHAKKLDQVMVATSQNVSDEPVLSFCKQEGITCFRGSENDVLDRFYQAARFSGADVIVRITADCPLVDPIVIDRVVNTYLNSECDYASNSIKRTYPDGLDVEVFSFEALEQAWRKANLMSEREHVTPYIWKNNQIYKISQNTQEKNLSFLRWTVDEAEDLELVRDIYSSLFQEGEVFLAEDIINLLKQRSRDLSKFYHQPTKINEGYWRSLQEDRTVSLPVENNDAGGV